jgi:hypothetical protein
MDMMSQIKRWFWVVGVGTAVVLAAVWVAYASPPATAEELVEWTLQASDLPHAADRVGQVTYVYDVSQPLHKDNTAEATPEEVALLTSYTAAAKSGGLVGERLEGAEVAYVGHYWYAYDTRRTAQAAADLLLSKYVEFGESVHLQTYPGRGWWGLQGEAMMLTGSEGESIYVFVGTKGPHLTLLIADTFWQAQETSEAQFFGMVEALLQK